MRKEVMRLTKLRSLVTAALVIPALGLCVSTAAAQPVINDVTAVDVIFSTIGQGVDGIAQGGIAQIWGDGVAKDIGSDTYPSRSW